MVKNNKSLARKALAVVLAMSVTVNAAFAAALMEARHQLATWEAEHQAQLERSDHVRDLAVEQLGELAIQLEESEQTRDMAIKELCALSLHVAQERQARAELAEAYEAVGDWMYVGECVITAYCPCEECCGRWADGLTATGIPAGPGIVAVDPDIIPLGATVIIDGQRYLAADTGVTGLHVDLFLLDHSDTVAFGVRTADVWMASRAK